MFKYVLYTNNLKQGLLGPEGELAINPSSGLPYFQGVDWTPGGQLPPFLASVWHDDSITVYQVENSQPISGIDRADVPVKTP